MDPWGIHSNNYKRNEMNTLTHTYVCYDLGYYSFFFGSAFLCFRVRSISNAFRKSQTWQRERAQKSECSDCLYLSICLSFVHASDFYELLHTIPISLCRFHTSASATPHINRQVPSFNHLCTRSLPFLSLYFSLFFSLQTIHDLITRRTHV